MTNFRTSVLTLDRPGDRRASLTRPLAQRRMAIIARYPAGQGRSALLPMLHLVQSVQSQITPDGIAFCADQLGLTKAQVAAVATFYTMYKRKPTGEYLVSVCTNTLCGMLGGDEIFAVLSRTNSGSETTRRPPTARSRSSMPSAWPRATTPPSSPSTTSSSTTRTPPRQCAHHGQRSCATARSLEPSRGAPICSFKQISRQIAGFFDDEAAVAPNANGSGVPTEIGVKLAIDRGETAPSYAVTAGKSVPAAAEPAKAPVKRAPRKAAAAKAAESEPAPTLFADDAPESESTED